MLEKGEYLAGQTVSVAQIWRWVEQFHRDGFMFPPNVLPPHWVAQLKQDLERALAEQPHASLGGLIDECTRMFECSPAPLRLFDAEPIVGFASRSCGTAGEGEGGGEDADHREPPRGEGVGSTRPSARARATAPRRLVAPSLP